MDRESIEGGKGQRGSDDGLVMESVVCDLVRYVTVQGVIWSDGDEEGWGDYISGPCKCNIYVCRV